jgi:hypothetical protein
MHAVLSTAPKNIFGDPLLATARRHCPQHPINRAGICRSLTSALAVRDIFSALVAYPQEAYR